MVTARRTPPRGTPAPAVLAGGVRRFDDPSDPFAAKPTRDDAEARLARERQWSHEASLVAASKAEARDRGVDSAGNAALAEEVARLRAEVNRAAVERDMARRDRDRAERERDEVTAELDRLTATVAEYATREPAHDEWTVARAVLDAIMATTGGSVSVDTDGVIEVTVHTIDNATAIARFLADEALDRTDAIGGGDLAETAEDVVSRLVCAAREASPW